MSQLENKAYSMSVHTIHLEGTWSTYKLAQAVRENGTFCSQD